MFLKSCLSYYLEINNKYTYLSCPFIFNPVVFPWKSKAQRFPSSRLLFMGQEFPQHEGRVSWAAHFSILPGRKEPGREASSALGEGSHIASFSLVSRNCPSWALEVGCPVPISGSRSIMVIPQTNKQKQPLSAYNSIYLTLLCFNVTYLSNPLVEN